MKAYEWQQFFRSQSEKHGKVVFTVTELANAAQVSPGVLNVELSRLLKRGLIQRYAHGRYGLEGEIAPEHVLRSIDSSAYLTGFYALFRHNMVTQVPTQITCFTVKRHNRSRERTGPSVNLVFVCVSRNIYNPPPVGLLAPAEQALCDFIYLTNRQSLRAESLVTFRHLDRLSMPKLRRLLKHYPRTVKKALERLGIFPEAKTAPPD